MTLFITLAHTFLYMTNYYVFAPTANLYTEALGFSKSMSGVMMAMAPISAGIFGFLFSWWSNYSFKKPLVFGLIMILIGNLCYAAAYELDSLWMLMAGRFLFGIGGARAVNRRYIADFVSLKAMTKYCAYFVAMSALGLVVGPMLASLIAFLPDYKWNHVELNEYTFPGYLSLIVWIPFSFFIICCYTEPDKREANYNKLH